MALRTADTPASLEPFTASRRMETTWVVPDKPAPRGLTTVRSGYNMKSPWQWATLWVPWGGQNPPQGIDGSWRDLADEERQKSSKYHPLPLNHVPSKPWDCRSPGSPVQEGQFQECRWVRGIGTRNRADTQVEGELMKKHILLCQQRKVKLDKWIHGSN